MTGATVQHSGGIQIYFRTGTVEIFLIRLKKPTVVDEDDDETDDDDAWWRRFGWWLRRRRCSGDGGDDDDGNDNNDDDEIIFLKIMATESMISTTPCSSIDYEDSDRVLYMIAVQVSMI